MQVWSCSLPEPICGTQLILKSHWIRDTHKLSPDVHCRNPWIQLSLKVGHPWTCVGTCDFTYLFMTRLVLSWILWLRTEILGWEHYSQRSAVTLSSSYNHHGVKIKFEPLSVLRDINNIKYIQVSFMKQKGMQLTMEYLLRWIPIPKQ